MCDLGKLLFSDTTQNKNYWYPVVLNNPLPVLGTHPSRYPQLLCKRLEAIDCSLPLPVVVDTIKILFACARTNKEKFVIPKQELTEAK